MIPSSYAYALIAALVLSSCSTTTTVRPLEGGGTVTTTEKGLTDRAAGVGVAVGGRLLDAYLPPRAAQPAK